MELIKLIDHHKIGIREDLMLHVPVRPTLTNWKKVGGQLIIDRELEKLIEKIKTGKILNWEQVHKFYHHKTKEYQMDKLNHAVAAYQKVYNASIRNKSNEELLTLITSSVSTTQWIVRDIFESRAKEY